MSQVLMEDDVLYGDAALLCINDLSMRYDLENKTHYIDLDIRDNTIIRSGFAHSPRQTR